MVLGLGQKLNVILKTADAITGRLAVEYADDNSDYKGNSHFKTTDRNYAKKPKKKRGKK